MSDSQDMERVAERLADWCRFGGPNDVRQWPEIADDIVALLSEREAMKGERENRKRVALILAGIPEPWRSTIETLDADRRAAEARATQAEGENERLREALKEVLRDAELGNFLRERCAYSYGNGYSEPREYSIAWEWQQRTPNDSSGAALAEQIAEHFANVAEVEAELGDELQPWDRNPVLAARAALQEPRS